MGLLLARKKCPLAQCLVVIEVAFSIGGNDNGAFDLSGVDGCLVFRLRADRSRVVYISCSILMMIESEI